MYTTSDRELFCRANTLTVDNSNFTFIEIEESV